MAVKASATIPIYKVIDVASTTVYYKLQSSTANPPAKPTTDVPSGWVTTEPTYTEGSTNTLYTVIKTKYSDGTFEYTPVSKSSSYEAAKSAYNKAVAAQNNINNLEVGGRNLGRYGCIRPYNTSSNTAVDNSEFRKNGKCTITRKSVANEGPIIDYGVIFDPGEKYTISFRMKKIAGTIDHIQVYNGLSYADGIVYIDGIRKGGFHSNIVIADDTNYHDYKLIFTGKDNSSQANLINTNHLILQPAKSNSIAYTVEIIDFKIETGTVKTAWTPALEDMEFSSAEVIVGTQTSATASWTGIASFDRLQDKQQIAYWLPYNSANNATLNLTLSNGLTTGAIPLYYGGTSRLTTHYGAGNVVHLTYRENVKIGNTTIAKGWWADANYVDGNNTDRLRFQNNIKTNKQYIYSGRILVSNSDGYFPLHGDVTFDRDKAMLFAGSNLVPWINTNSNNNYLAYSGWDMRNNGYMYFSGSWKVGTYYDLINAEIPAGNKIYSGTKITGTSTTATIFSGSGITSAKVNDRYLNINNGNYYKCTVAGAATAAKWVYEGNSIIPAGKRIFWGTHLTHTDGSAKATATAISNVSLGDQYINHSTGRLYECTKAGASGTAQWTDRGVILQPNKTVYLVGVLSGQSIVVDSTPFTTEIPKSEDGKVYIAIGMSYSIYGCSLFPEHPMFMFKDGLFKSMEQITYESYKVANEANNTASKASSDIERFLEGDETTTLALLKRSVSEEIDQATGAITDHFDTLVAETPSGQAAIDAAEQIHQINSFIKRSVNANGQPYIELGVQPSSSVPQTYRLRIENDEIYMVYGSGDSENLTPLTRWYSKDGKSAFEVNTLLTQQEMAIEPFRFIKNDDGSLSFRKVE